MHVGICPGVPLRALHGKMKQLKRMAVFYEFAEAKAMVLFATDIAARGLDFPTVDWVIQVCYAPQKLEPIPGCYLRVCSRQTRCPQHAGTAWECQGVMLVEACGARCMSLSWGEISRFKM